MFFEDWLRECKRLLSQDSPHRGFKSDRQAHIRNETPWFLTGRSGGRPMEMNAKRAVVFKGQ